MEPELADADRLFARFQRTCDARALGEVYDRLAPELLRIALHTSRDAAEAEDVLQATFVTAIERAASFDTRQRVMPWLVGILANEARRARLEQRRQPDPERLETAIQPGPERDAEQRELLERLDAALDSVPEVFRPVLQLKLRHDLTVTEIASALGRPSGTVRSQLARGTELLRRTLPAGLAGALLACSAPTRGLAAVRAAVVEHAAGLQVPWTASTAASTVIGGLFAVKKLAALAALLVVALSVWVATRPPQPVGAAADAVATLPPAPSVVPGRTGEPQAKAPEEPLREALAAAPAPASATPSAPRGAELAVRVRWPDDSLAEGEVVLVSDARSPYTDEALSAATDREGLARFHELAPGRMQVRLLRGGETMAQLREGEEQTVELSIRAGVTIAGRVVDARGEPVAAAELWLSERYRTNLGHVVGKSDERGAFVVRAVSPDHYLGARKRGFTPSGLRTLRGAPGDRFEVELRLEGSAGLVRGRVLTAEGAPVAGAQVLLGDEWPSFSERLDDGSFGPAGAPERARTGADGAFELASAPFGPRTMQVRAAGFAPCRTTVEVLEARPNEFTVELLRAARVVGRVSAPDGSPVPSVSIRCGDVDLFASSSAWSWLDGTFELDGLGGGRQDLVAQRTDLGEARIELHLRPGETYDWQVELQPAIAIHGQLVDAHGEPLEGHVVVAVPGNGNAQRVRSEQSDAAGRFLFTPLANEAHLLWVQRPLGWREFPLLELRDVWPTSTPLVLRVPEPDQVAGRITAQVVAPDGAPVAGAELQVWHAERRAWRSFVSQGESAAVLAENVPAGTVELELRHPDHPWKHLGEHRIEAGATLDLGRIELAPAGSLRARLDGLPDELYAGLRAMLADEANKESGVVHIAPGELTTGPLAPGQHTLVLSGDFVRDLRVVFEVRPGVEESRDFTLERCGLREVAFTLPAAEAMPRWIACSLHDQDGRLVWGGNADCTRTPPVARVSAPPGEYELRVRGAGELTGQTPFSIVDLHGQQEPLLLPLARQP